MVFSINIVNIGRQYYRVNFVLDASNPIKYCRYILEATNIWNHWEKRPLMSNY